ncbi:hypothetical protein AMJ80_04500 [bacterium SM23_31]|nr:MAG: hypothetical protein AMJ80_04500 [bacterium SM23_31]
MVGIIKGAEIGLNRDGNKNRLLLQVELIPEDVRTAELISQAGEDTYPGEGSRVLILNAGAFLAAIASTDDLEPETEAGEKEFYSTDSPITSKLARIKLNKNSEIIMNEGTDFAVAYTDLKTAFDKLKTDFNNFISVFNAHTHPYVDTPIGASVTSATATPGTSSTADMSGSKVEKVKLP